MIKTGSTVVKRGMVEAKNLGAPYELLEYYSKNGKLPVVNFVAGGVATQLTQP